MLEKVIKNIENTFNKIYKYFKNETIFQIKKSPKKYLLIRKSRSVSLYLPQNHSTLPNHKNTINMCH